MIITQNELDCTCSDCNMYMCSTVWKCQLYTYFSHYNLGLHNSSILTDMFWAKTKCGKCAEGNFPQVTPPPQL